MQKQIKIYIHTNIPIYTYADILIFMYMYRNNIHIYYRTNTGKYYELDTALPRVRRTSGTLYPTSNISRYLCDNKFIVYSPAHPV